MKRMSLTVAVAAVSMVVAGAFGLVAESQLFDSTPEDVAEGFVRTLVAGDYGDALEYFDRTLNKDIDTVDLRHFAVFIALRSGQVREVYGVRGRISGSRAEASARLLTESGG